MEIEPKNEAELQQLIQMEARTFGCILMRNNSGALVDREGRLVRFGLDNTSKERNEKIKSSDLIGFTRIKITQEMVGQTVAIFTATEIKSPDWKSSPTDKRERAQAAFIAFVRMNGGIGAIVNSIKAFKEMLGV